MQLSFMEILKVIFLGVVEGITEWLPISSTGHMLLVDEFLRLNASDAFKEMFFVVIQLGAILAVVLLFWNKMFPFQWKDKTQPVIKKETFSLWLKVVVACVPGAVVTLLFDDYIEAHLHTPVVIANALIVYGVAFILIESWNKKRTPKVKNLTDITYTTALIIGLFQVLSIIPGTSRSGATIIGALIIGVSRVAAAEFTFFLAVPVMFGLSAIKIIKFGFAFTGAEMLILVIGMIVAFAVSVAVIKFLMSFIKKHDFKAFGWYRIVLGIIVLLYFTFA
ncbi:MAG: undecaprenyl-diphosphate phosphatase [Oscillospiraceae bacterium]|nr:undecaprenyl-diphosphate phosphatase [Oscillospiraceae bacterium]